MREIVRYCADTLLKPRWESNPKEVPIKGLAGVDWEWVKSFANHSEAPSIIPELFILAQEVIDEYM